MKEKDIVIADKNVLEALLLEKNWLEFLKSVFLSSVHKFLFWQLRT